MRKTIHRHSRRSPGPGWLLAVVTVATAVLAALTVTGAESLAQGAASPLAAPRFITLPAGEVQALPQIAPDAEPAGEQVPTF